MTKISNPITIKSVTFKNRIGMSPMCQYSATDGFANNWHNVHYTTRAVGGVGLIIVEATAVSPNGRITPYDLGIWKDEQISDLKILAEDIHSHGSVAGIQIAHAGRKASHDVPWKGSKQLNVHEGGWQTMAPSPISFDPEDISPIEMTISDIRTIINQFRDAARRAFDAGFKVLEIHAAHGYLIHQFLSPLSNTRTDDYGGNFENRVRLLLEITSAIKEVWPSSHPLFVRISATDWVENGWNLIESVKLSASLKEKGIDLIDCSSGGNIISAKISKEAGYQVPFAEAIRDTGIMTAAVGLIDTEEQISNILENEKADIVLLGRELLRNPYFVLNSINNKSWPLQYLRAKRHP